MSNPFDPSRPPGASGQPPPPPPPFAAYPGWGSGPPRPGAPYPPPGPTRPSTDAVSITAFVLSLTFCLSVVGFVLGLVGLSRTRGGRRTGRWAAVSAVVIGVVFSTLAVLLVVGIVRTAQREVTIADAEVGQCVELSETGGRVGLSELDCTESHDAEIVYVGQRTPGLFTDGTPEQLCRDVMDEDDVRTLDAAPVADELRWTALTGSFRDPGYLCYVEARTGSLDSPILG